MDITIQKFTDLFKKKFRISGMIKLNVSFLGRDKMAPLMLQS